LDKFLTFLSSKFAFLETLDLFGNPLAEEPDYRLKIIHTMPQVKLLDRHMVTLEERLKAAKLFENTPVSGNSHSKRGQTAPKPNNNGSFSKGERDLYKNVAQLKKLDEEKKLREEQERLNFYK
jgi:Leucine-rich repeat